MRFGWDQRKRPTPQKMKAIGYALLAGSAAISSGLATLWAAYKEDWLIALSAAVIVIGGLGKFMTIFFGEAIENENTR